MARVGTNTFAGESARAPIRLDIDVAGGVEAEIRRLCGLEASFVEGRSFRVQGLRGG